MLNSHSTTPPDYDIPKALDRAGMLKRMSRPAFSIRPATPADMPGVGLMQHACWMKAYRGIMDHAFLSQLSAEGMAKYHGQHFDPQTGKHVKPRMPFLVAEEPGAPNPILGMVRGGPTREKTAAGDPVPPTVFQRFPFELFAIHVAHDKHRRGIGRALFTEFFRAAQDLGESSVVLWVLSNNAPARAFYESLGGAVVGESFLTLGGKAYPQTAYGWERLVI